MLYEPFRKLISRARLAGIRSSALRRELAHTKERAERLQRETLELRWQLAVLKRVVAIGGKLYKELVTLNDNEDSDESGRGDDRGCSER